MQFINVTSTLLLLALAGPVAAQQVYEKTDAEGNPSFSDMPSEGAEVIDVEPANVADSVDVPKVPPAAPSAAPQPGSQGGSTTQLVEENRLLINNDDEDRGKRPRGELETKRNEMLTPVDGNVEPAHGRSKDAETEAERAGETRTKATHRVIHHGK